MSKRFDYPKRKISDLIEISDTSSEYFENNVFDRIPLYKIYNDGGHFVATKAYDRKFFRVKKEKTENDNTFDELYQICCDDNLEEKETKKFIKDNLCLSFDDDTKLNNFVDKKIKQKKHNYFNRIKRLRRKANINYWSHFVTITYDSKKFSEEVFKRKLRKCLSNLHSRYNWKYMGVFEYSPEKERLHFHAIMYIPCDKMVGEIFEKRDYSTKKHEMQTRFENSFFAKRFGVNDFKSIQDRDSKNSLIVNYLVKYINKSSDRIIYSRGIPTEIYKRIDEKNIVTHMIDYVIKYILFDDVIDIKRDVMRFEIKQMNMFDDMCLLL